MKIDPHVHSSGISKCSRVSYEQIVSLKKQAGYDGAVLVNHCQPWYFTDEEYQGWMRSFIEEFKNAYEYGKNNGFLYFLGIEVSIENPHYADFLLYGVTEECLLAAPNLCKLNQKQLYEFCCEWNITLVQAHPLREGHVFLDPRFMHGVEINLRPGDLEMRDQVEKLAREHGLLITVGSDYHTAKAKEIGGLIIPNSVKTAKQLSEYLQNTNSIEYFIENEIFIFNKF
ncbi:MAG: hypothetical protein IJW13_01960 [Clostridia bacterium]|nr:hypothetical protein [Clostridia bacterium]